MDNFVWDTPRQSRTGISEAVLCEGKSNADLLSIIQFNMQNNRPLLLTRISNEQWLFLPDRLRAEFDFDPISQSAMFKAPSNPSESLDICIVTAGTSDLRIATETQRVIQFNGIHAPIFADLGVAGLWRLMDKIDTIRQYKIIIALAGMEGALFSVLAGLVESPVIAVPTSVGYGVSAGGQAALSSALASCAPGILTMNIDNGFGAATSAIKIIQTFKI